VKGLKKITVVDCLKERKKKSEEKEEKGKKLINKLWRTKEQSGRE